MITLNQTKSYRPGASGALLDEYEKALIELQHVFSDVSDIELLKIVDSQTKDPECKSIQTVLTHVVSSAYSYSRYISKMKGIDFTKPDSAFRETKNEYTQDLKTMFAFTENIFQHVKDNELEELDNSLKVLTTWGQLYDIEQIMEHAIVHILRHRRQIEKFKLILRNHK